MFEHFFHLTFGVGGTVFAGFDQHFYASHHKETDIVSDWCGNLRVVESVKCGVSCGVGGVHGTWST